MQSVHMKFMANDDKAKLTWCGGLMLKRSLEGGVVNKRRTRRYQQNGDVVILLKISPTIRSFLLEAKRRNVRENIRESTWMSNQVAGTCAERYDPKKVDNTPQQAPMACVVRKTEEGPEHIYHSDKRNKYDASISTNDVRSAKSQGWAKTYIICHSGKIPNMTPQ